MRALVSLWIASCGGGRAAPVGNPGGLPGKPPEPAELRALIAAAGSHRFDADAQDRACTVAPTLAGYMQVLQTESATGKEHHLTGTCGEFPSDRAMIDPPASPAYWYCRIDALSKDDDHDILWHYELRFRVRQADRTLDLEHLACPGTP